jgi:hypothetical protein
MLIQENKWRAVRYGLEGKLIDFGKQTEVPVGDLVLELLEFVDDVVDELGSRKEIDHIHTILKRGTSADRQLEVYRETNDLKAVVDDLIKMTLENVPVTTDFGVPAPQTTARRSRSKAIRRFTQIRQISLSRFASQRPVSPTAKKSA